MSTTRRVALGNKLYRAVVTSIRTNGVTYTEHAGPYDKPGPAKAFVTRWTGPDNIWGGVHEISGHVEVGDVTWRRLDEEQQNPSGAPEQLVTLALTPDPREPELPRWAQDRLAATRAVLRQPTWRRLDAEPEIDGPSAELVEIMAQIIRTVDGNHTMGAAQLAEAIPCLPTQPRATP
jgi:hypothetical protein